jgi:hypothetical protein
MRRISGLLCGLTVLAGTTGCIVVPPHGGRGGGSATVYVEPGYASPGPGWAWELHASEGWGWHHPQRGWHRGWR